MTSLPSFLAASISEGSAAIASRGADRINAAPPTSATASERSSSLIMKAPSGGDFPRHRTIAERGGHEQRVNAGAARDQHADVAGFIRHADVVRVAGLGEPAGAPMLEAFHRSFGKA